MTSFQWIITSLSVCPFIADFEEPGNRIMGTWSIILKLSIASLCLTKTENKTKSFLRQLPSKHFNVVSTLSFGWYGVGTWGNVKSTLKQRCVFQRWNLQRRTTLNKFLLPFHNLLYFAPHVKLNTSKRTCKAEKIL